MNRGQSTSINVDLLLDVAESMHNKKGEGMAQTAIESTLLTVQTVCEDMKHIQTYLESMNPVLAYRFLKEAQGRMVFVEQVLKDYLDKYPES